MSVGYGHHLWMVQIEQIDVDEFAITMSAMHPALSEIITTHERISILDMPPGISTETMRYGVMEAWAAHHAHQQ